MMKKLASIGFLQLIGIAINAVRSKIFAVALGPAGFGIVATIDQLVMSLVQLCGFSLPYAALKLLSRSDSLSKSEFRSAYFAFFKLILAVAVVTTLLVVFVVPPLMSRLESDLASFQGTTTIALAGLAAAMMTIFLVNVLAARQASAHAVMLTVASSAVALVASVLGFLAGGIQGVYVASVAATSVFIAVAFWTFHRRLGIGIDARTDTVASMLRGNKDLVRIAFWVYVSLASTSALLAFVRYVVLIDINTEAAAFLQACIGVSLSIGAVLGPATFLYFAPLINREMPNLERFQAANEFLPRLVLLYCLGALPVLLFPETTLFILYSSEFSVASTILPWFIARQCITQFSNIYQQLLISLDDLRGFGLVVVAGNAVAGILCVLAIQRYQLLGVATGLLAGSIVTCLLTVVRLRVSHKLIVPRSAIALAVAVTLIFAVVAGLGRLTAETSWIGVSARVATGTVFLFGMWIALPASLKLELRAVFDTRWKRWFGGQ